MADWFQTKHQVGQKSILFKSTSSESSLIEVSKYRLLPGEKVEPHSHDSKKETYWITKGKIEFHLNDKISILEENDFILVNEGQCHSLLNASEEAAEFIIHHIKA